MTLKAKIKKLEDKMAYLRYQQKEVALIVDCYACRNSYDDEYCEHEQQSLDKWIAEHGGREPDEVIWIIGVPGRQDWQG